jgi:tetratricopeptide (TPR) repeat protein
MFEFLKRKRRAPEKARTNSIDELVNRLQSEGKADTLEDVLRELDPNCLSGAERESWYQLWGIMAFRRGDRVEAFARFVAARAAIPESSRIAFSLAQEHEYRGELDQMFQLFDDHRFPSLPASYAFLQARYAYLWDDFDRGLRYVEPILQAHFNLKIADDMFLYMRGMPVFSQTWAYLAAFYELKGDLGLAVQLTQDARHKLIDYDFSEHERLLTAVRSSD